MQSLMTLADLPHAIILVGDRAQGEQEILALSARELGLSAGDPDLFLRSVPLWSREDSSDLVSFVSLRSVGERKIAIVSASQFSDRAQDPLLKTIEEPGGKTTIFILVEREGVLLPTIRSRARMLAVAGESVERKQVRDMAQGFLRATVAKRLTLIAPLTEKLDGDSDRVKEEKRKQKEDARLLVQELAVLLSAQHEKKGSEAVLLAGRLLASPSPNLRLLLEHIAFSLPTEKKPLK